MAKRRQDLIVVGASFGGVEALGQLVRGLPADLGAALCVVQHVAPTTPSVLPAILTRLGGPPATHARHGEPLRTGHIYVAPPDRHLLVRDGRLLLSRGPRENHTRPAVDPLFRSAARAYGERVVGVVLTGALDCGSAGMVAVKRAGGLAVVQDPDEALCGDMPRATLDVVHADHVVRLGAMGPLLVGLSGREPPGRQLSAELGPPPDGQDALELAAELPHGDAQPLTCPDCGSSLAEEGEAPLRLRCRTGHAFTGVSLSAEQEDLLEAALWTALRTLQESAQLNARMAERARESGRSLSAERFQERTNAAREQAALVRRVLLHPAQHGIHPAQHGEGGEGT
jgi:two-component system chemotaxis response regulator CheB